MAIKTGIYPAIDTRQRAANEAETISTPERNRVIIRRIERKWGRYEKKRGGKEEHVAKTEERKGLDL